MAIAKNLVFHASTKHIEIQYHFVRELIIDEEVDLVYYLTEDNATDIFTKALGRDLLERHLHQLSIGLKSSSFVSGSSPTKMTMDPLAPCR